MLAKCHFALLAALLVFVSGCGKQISTSKAKSGPDEVFGVAQAMKVLYGNYDAKSQTSLATLPRGVSSLPGPGLEPMTIRVLLNAFTSGAGAKTFVLVTYAVPTSGDFACHGCGPTIGMATFSEKGGTWAIDASNRAITSSGGWGEPSKDLKLVQIGPNHTGVTITDVGGGQGETTAVLQILVPWRATVNLALERIISDNDAGACAPDGLPCYSNLRTITFVRDANSDYYHIETTLSGTDLPASDNPRVGVAKSVSGVEILKFDNGKYVQVSRSGDLTSVDRAMAEQEGLK